MVYDPERIVLNLDEEIEWLEVQLNMDKDDEDYDLENPDYAYYTLQVLYAIRGDWRGDA